MTTVQRRVGHVFMARRVGHDRVQQYNYGAPRQTMSLATGHMVLGVGAGHTVRMIDSRASESVVEENSNALPEAEGSGSFEI